jgi:nucleotidyltransferase substrate binding protein (TIGR01987 family)
VEELVKKYTQLNNALNRLQEGIEYYDMIEKYEDLGLRLLIRDGLIQRYEFSIELFRKVLDLYLTKVHLVILESRGAYHIFRATERAGIISNEEFVLLSQLIFDRNETSHTYLEALAIEIADRIPAHYQVMKKILERIKI